MLIFKKLFRKNYSFQLILESSLRTKWICPMIASSFLKWWTPIILTINSSSNKILFKGKNSLDPLSNFHLQNNKRYKCNKCNNNNNSNNSHNHLITSINKRSNPSNKCLSNRWKVCSSNSSNSKVKVMEVEVVEVLLRDGSKQILSIIRIIRALGRISSCLITVTTINIQNSWWVLLAIMALETEATVTLTSRKTINMIRLLPKMTILLVLYRSSNSCKLAIRNKILRVQILRRLKEDLRVCSSK